MPIQNCENTEFIDFTLKEIATGGGFVPFIGSGCSSPSGILMGQQFDEYLAYTVYLCVADRVLGGADAATGGGRWNLRVNGWPKLPSQQQVHATKVWTRKNFDKICGRCGFTTIPGSGVEIETIEPVERAQRPEDVANALNCPLLPRILRAAKCSVNQDAVKRLFPLLNSDGLIRGGYSMPGISPTSLDAIVERAIRSLYDWRSTLRFLSELKVIETNTLLIDEPDSSIIDAFNIHITKGRKPNLTHTMLCHLAGPARMRVFLTTNFDTLIERAFQEMKEELETIHVTISGALPDPEIVHARNTIVKLHGTRWETRADFSLDASPSLESKQRFFHYVRGKYPGQGPCFLPAQLLVCGYSGSDNRCVEMIKYVLDADATAKLYWVCYSERDKARVAALFPESTYTNRIFVTVTERLDLLLYELYQRLCLSLPKGGFSYQYSHNVPPLVPLKGSEEKLTQAEAQRLLQESEWFEQESPARLGQPRKLVVADGGPGVLSVLRQTIMDLTQNQSFSQIWLELEDYHDTFSVAYDILLIISIRLGLFQLGDANLIPGSLMDRIEAQCSVAGRDDGPVVKLWIEHLSLLLRIYFNIVPSNWVIILYGRNGPGGCAGWDETSYWSFRSDKAKEKGSDKKRAGRPAQAEPFATFLKALSSLGFCVIYAPYSDARRQHDASKASCLTDILHQHLREEMGVPGQPDQTRSGRGPDEFSLPDAHSNHNIDRALLAAQDFDGITSPSSPPRSSGAPDPGESPRRYPGMVRYFRPPIEKPDAPDAINFKNCMSKLTEGWIMPTASRNCRESQSRDPYPPYLKTLRFLYTSTLFRQSRHYSAFLNEGVMPCPFRYNPVGLDNDWIRNQELEKDLKELKAVGLFYDKPGGFAWAYRDFRLGARKLIASLPEPYLKKFKVERLDSWRSHYHYWISDWYMRAFYTTGHAIPLMEAIYHLFQCIDHVDTFREGLTGVPLADSASTDKTRISLGWRRYRLWHAAACDMTKALRLGRASIRLWFGTPQFRSWFPGGEASQHLVQQIEKPLERILQSLPDQAKNRRQDAEAVLASLQGEIRELTLHGNGRTRYKEFFTQAIQVEKVSPRSGPHSAPASCIQSLRKIVENGTRPLTVDSGQLRHAVAQWELDQIKAASSQEYLCDLVQQLTEESFEYVKEASIYQAIATSGSLLAELRGSSSPGRPEPRLHEKIKAHWILVTVFAASALHFCRHVHPVLDNCDYKERVKSLCLYGIALGRLGRFYEAHRRLNEANALLSRMDGRSDSQANRGLLGILKLRRAEVHLTEALIILELRTTGTCLGLNEPHLRQRYSSDGVTLRPPEELRRQQAAKLDDAWCALETAEKLLSGQVQSPRWWGILCLLKLRCLSVPLPIARLPAGPAAQGTGAPFRLLAQRNQCERFDQVFDVFCQGLASLTGHPTLRLFLIDYTLRALLLLKTEGHPSSPDAWRQAVGRVSALARPLLKTPHRPDDSLGKSYARKINDLVRTCEKLDFSGTKKPRQAAPARPHPRPAGKRSSKRK